MSIELRDWQKDAYEAFKSNNYRGILKVGTGKGKTVFALYCIKEFMKENPDFRTCIIVPTINLMSQWQRQIQKFLSIQDVSLLYGREKNTTGQIVIAVVNSAVNDSNLLRAKPFDFMIADECHHYGSTLFSKIFQVHTPYALGLSATPEREKDKEGTVKIIEGIGEKVFELNHLDDPSAIPQFVIWSILVELTSEEKNTYEENSFEIVKLNNYFEKKFGFNADSEDYIDKIKELADKKNPAALKLLSFWSKQANIRYCAVNKLAALTDLVKMEQGNKILIFNERIEFTKRIYAELQKQNNLHLSLIHSELSKREIQEKLDDFKDSESGILIAPRLIDEGYDVPDAAVAIVVSFTRSARQMIQRDGRILRKTPEKMVATRYSLVIEGLEEERYYTVLRTAEMASKALDGEWLKYDPFSLTFSQSKAFKDGFLNFDKVKEHHKNQFKEWVVKKLDYHEDNVKKRDLDEIERRLEFFTKFMDVIESLSEKYPDRWKNLSEKLKKQEVKNVIFRHTVPHKEREILREELRHISARVLLPSPVFNAIMRFIENEPFELDPLTKDYITNLTGGKKPDIWPDKLFSFIKNIMSTDILK